MVARRVAQRLQTQRSVMIPPPLESAALFEASGLPRFLGNRMGMFFAKGGQGMTQFGRALAELNIDPLCELQPGEGPCGTCQPNAAVQAGEGAAPGRHL
jgi:hypothetical protein